MSFPINIGTNAFINIWAKVGDFVEKFADKRS